MQRTTIQELVTHALTNAVANEEFNPGGNLHGMTVEQIADDLAAFDAELEDFSPVEIQPFVIEWVNERQWLNAPKSGSLT